MKNYTEDDIQAKIAHYKQKENYLKQQHDDSRWVMLKFTQKRCDAAKRIRYWEAKSPTIQAEKALKESKSKLERLEREFNEAKLRLEKFKD